MFNQNQVSGDSLLQLYRHGRCASLAMAVNRQLGLACVVFFSDDEEANAVHAANVMGDRYIDVSGVCSLADIELYYGLALKPVVDRDGSETLMQFAVAMGEYSEDGVGAEAAWADCSVIIVKAIAQCYAQGNGNIDEPGKNTVVQVSGAYWSTTQLLAALGAAPASSVMTADKRSPDCQLTTDELSNRIVVLGAGHCSSADQLLAAALGLDLAAPVLVLEDRYHLPLNCIEALKMDKRDFTMHKTPWYRRQSNGKLARY